MANFNIDRSNLDYIEEMYHLFRRNPASVDEGWQGFFKGFELGHQTLEKPDMSAVLPEVETGAKGVDALVQAYRQWGHFNARIDPLDQGRPPHPLLELSEFGLNQKSLDTEAGSGGFLGLVDGSLGDLLEKLRSTYCGSIGVEYGSGIDKARRDWLLKQIEADLPQDTFEVADKQALLGKLLAAEEFEGFLQRRYPGQKRFSLEGGDVLVPLLHTLVNSAARLGAEEMVIGMAHRGRLNVLTHILDKPYQEIFAEFDGAVRHRRDEDEGDVKYHMGYSCDYSTAAGEKIHLSLCPNPSHLELVNPVIEGIVRAKQDGMTDRGRQLVVPVLIHGDAAFTGQGIVSETLNLSQLEGYQTGGTIHIIINNQLGYTALPAECRFTDYPTDLAKEAEVPVFHLNANDPEAVVQAAEIAIEYRATFKRDIIIDLWCYRRYGHNEADDPTLTQPLMYQKIKNLPTAAQIYSAQLVEGGALTAAQVEALRRERRDKLESAHKTREQVGATATNSVFGGLWKGLEWAGDIWDVDTSVKAEVLGDILAKTTRVPAGFTRHRTLDRVAAARREMGAGDRGVDWGCAEMLAFGSLLLEKYPVRLAGQDSQRGTFAHRNAVWHDGQSGQRYVPLAHLSEDQAEFTVLNTMVSELAVLGFEYGMSSADPRRLCLWEAQFGDFANGAQMIIDQFICCAEAKWQRMSGLVLLLPHGYEGQGPEHSSARLERFLQLCAADNMQVVYPTTPAQYFHLLRRQMLRKFRKPLVVMAPKSLLRHPEALSPIDALTNGTFAPVIDLVPGEDAAQVRRVLLCSGKIYYDLLEAWRDNPKDEVALVRLEELYPFPANELERVMAKYPAAEEVFWVQEESRNMGAWNYVQLRLEEILDDEVGLSYIGRDEAPSSATGIYQLHIEEQRRIVESALDIEKSGLFFDVFPARDPS